MITDEPAASSGTGAYHLRRPTLADARSAVARAVGAQWREEWDLLLAMTGLSGAERGREDLEVLIAAMEASLCPAVAVCARTLRVRLTTWEQLSRQVPSPGGPSSAPSAGATRGEVPGPRAVAGLPLPDAARLATQAMYDLDNPVLRQRLDELSARTAAALERPVGLTTLVLDGAQVVAGSCGVTGWIAEAGGTPAEWSFCAHAVSSGEPYVVPDARHDPVQRENPLVTVDGFASYAGAPLATADGHVIGAHCVLDLRPHELDERELGVLRRNAAEAVAILEDFRLLR
ncbi:hypothetical protein NUM3379_04190 [Kineococcus sp. NUM-3379]